MNPQNDHIRRTMETADRVTHRLIQMGFTVLDVHVAEASPRIEVLPGEPCNSLREAINVVIERGPRGQREQTITARVDGALVQWKESA